MSALKIELLEPRLTLDRSPGEIEPSEVQNAPQRKGLALWQALRGARLFPARQQMSPRALGALVRNLVLVKVLDGGAEFQVRLIGDGIMAVQSDPLQGLTTAEIDQVLPGYGTVLHQLYTRACNGKVPLAFRGHFVREADKRTFHREHLLLPLGDTDAAVDHLVSIIVYTHPTV